MIDEEEFIQELIESGGPELAAAVEREFRTGWDLQRHQALAREQARSQTPHATSGGMEGMGTISSSIAAESYFYWLNYGRKNLGVQNIWAEEEFRKDYLRDNSQARVKYQSLAPTSGWTPQMEAKPIITAGKYSNVKEVAA